MLGVGPPVEGVVKAGDLTGEILSPCATCDNALEEGSGESSEYCRDGLLMDPKFEYHVCDRSLISVNLVIGRGCSG